MWEIAQLKRCDFAFAFGRPPSWIFWIEKTGFDKNAFFPCLLYKAGHDKAVGRIFEISNSNLIRKVRPRPINWAFVRDSREPRQ